MARGVFAGNLALRTKRLGFSHKVCFDGRGAYAAEWNEYEIIPDKNLISQVFPPKLSPLEPDPELHRSLQVK